MSLSNTTWNRKSNNAGQVGQPIASGQQVAVIPIAISGAVLSTSFSYQITVHGGGIFPTPVTITPPKSQADIAKEKVEAFDRAMGIVG